MQVELVLITTGALVLGLGVWSNFLRKHTVVPEPFVAVMLGVLLGPSLPGWLDLAAWGDPNRILAEAARLTLATGLMAIALRLPPHYLERHGRSLITMVALVMPLMWLASSLLVYLLVGLPLWASLLVGAVLTPTDPIVTTSIMIGEVEEERLPAMLTTLLWEVGGAVVVGLGLGYAAGRALTWSEERRLIERHSFLAFTLALTLLTLGVAELLGTEGIFAVLLAGLAFTPRVGGSEGTEEGGVQEAVSQFFYLPVFTLFGLTIPWGAWLELGWTAPALVVAVLALRRLPAMLITPQGLHALRGRSDRILVGWFGPMGISTLLYALLALERTGLEEVWVLGSLLIFASVLVHGVTANPLSGAYARRAAARRAEDREAEDPRA